MEGSRLFCLVTFLTATVIVNGQIPTPCTTSMISTFTPCLNFITGSTANGSLTPTQGCCDSLKTLTGGSMDCVCLMLTANVPIQLPINRTLALSLPRACKMGGVPLQCKASGAPLPAPGPALLGPSLSPTSPLTPTASKALAPESDTTFEPASPPEDSEIPTTTSGIRPMLTPPSSVSYPSYISPPAILLLILGIIMAFNF